MVKTKDFSRFFNKRWKGITRLLNDLCKDLKKETLHALRVHTKKVKALSKLLEACSHKKTSFSIKPIKELYHLAGDIRTAQLNLDTLEKYRIAESQFEKDQRETIEKASTEICARKNEFEDAIKKLEKKFDKRFYDIDSATITTYYRDNIDQLAKNLLLPLNIEHLHDNRKILKNLMYGLKILPESLVSHLNLNEKYIDDLQDSIGKWHDDIVTRDLLLQHGADQNSLSKLKEEEQKMFNLINELVIDFDKKIIGTKY
jgi:CHAD domain-containing protein